MRYSRHQQEIKLATRDGSVEIVIAEIVAPGLAMFRVKYGWNITHVNTGMRLVEVIGKKSLALEAVNRLSSSSSLDLDWSSFGSFGNFSTVPKEAKRVVSEVNRWLYVK